MLLTSEGFDRLIAMITGKFKSEFVARNDNAEKILRGSYLDSIWTNYMLGKSKHRYNMDWDGVLIDWLRELIKNKPGKIEIWPESFYRTDVAVVDYSDGIWWDGKYRILCMVEHENNPGETKGHMRQFYDFNVPEKLLITWSNDKLSVEQIMYMAEETAMYCKENAIINAGNTILMVGDWNRLEKLLIDDGPIVETKNVFSFKYIETDL